MPLSQRGDITCLAAPRAGSQAETNAGRCGGSSGSATCTGPSWRSALTSSREPAAGAAAGTPSPAVISQARVRDKHALLMYHMFDDLIRFFGSVFRPSCRLVYHVCKTLSTVTTLCDQRLMATGDYIIRNNLGFGGKHLFEPFLGLLVLIVLYNSIGAPLGWTSPTAGLTDLVCAHESIGCGLPRNNSGGCACPTTERPICPQDIWRCGSRSPNTCRLCWTARPLPR